MTRLSDTTEYVVCGCPYIDGRVHDVALCVRVRDIEAQLRAIAQRIDQELGRGTVPAPVEDVPFREAQPTLLDGEVRK